MIYKNAFEKLRTEIQFVLAEYEDRSNFADDYDNAKFLYDSFVKLIEEWRTEYDIQRSI